MKSTLKTILSLAVFLTISTHLLAQNYVTNRSSSQSDSPFYLKSIGFRGGVNWSTMTKFPLIQNVTPDFNFLPAPSGAIFAELGINEKFSIQPEIAFTQKGFLIKEYTNISMGSDFLGFNIPIGGRLAFKTNYLEVPILAKIILGDAESTHAYLLAGPAIGYLFDARAVVDVLGIFPIRTDIGTGVFNKVDFSGITGMGVSIPMGRTNLFIEGRYQYGFSRVLDTGFVLLPVRNQTFGISAGVQIPLGR